MSLAGAHNLKPILTCRGSSVQLAEATWRESVLNMVVVGSPGTRGGFEQRKYQQGSVGPCEAFQGMTWCSLATTDYISKVVSSSQWLWSKSPVIHDLRGWEMRSKQYVQNTIIIITWLLIFCPGLHKANTRCILCLTSWKLS